METEEAKAREEAAKCGVIQEEVMRIQSDAEADLKAAEPLVVQAMAALGTWLYRLYRLYSLCSPPTI